MKKLFLLTLVFFSFVNLGFSQSGAKSRENKPKLIVGIVVEQMRQDYIDLFWDNLGNDGIKKLVNNGVSFNNASLNFSLTQTSPGLASIVTGCEPSEHGIIADYWFNNLTGAKEHCIIDNSYNSVGFKYAEAYSPKNLFSTTYSDEAKISNQSKSKSVSISLNPIASVLLGGYTADAAYWFETKTGQWSSSTYYMNKLPDWVNTINNNGVIDEYFTRIWNPLYDMSRYDKCSDSVVYKHGIDSYYKTFPYNYSEIVKNLKDYELLTMIPEGNTYVTDMALAALYNEGLGKGDVSDFLFIDYSVSENIGKLFGPQSVELQDLFLRLDRDIAHLIKVLEEYVGKNNLLIYFTSNHGVANVPKYLQDNKVPSGIFKNFYMSALTKSYLKASYGEKDFILDFNNNQIYLNRTLIEDSKLSLSELQTKIVSFIINSSGIANAITATELNNSRFETGLAHKMQNSFNQKRSGDILISLKVGWINDVPYATDHVSGYHFDTNVPLIWYGSSLKKEQVRRPVNITDIAPTISAILGVPIPPLTSGKPIPEILKHK